MPYKLVSSDPNAPVLLDVFETEGEGKEFIKGMVNAWKFKGCLYDPSDIYSVAEIDPAEETEKERAEVLIEKVRVMHGLVQRNAELLNHTEQEEVYKKMEAIEAFIRNAGGE